MNSILDNLAKLQPICRETYGTDRSNKPNNHCNWERLLPTTSSEFGWVENDEHFRKRLRQGSRI